VEVRPPIGIETDDLPIENRRSAPNRVGEFVRKVRVLRKYSRRDRLEPVMMVQPAKARAGDHTAP
jgi:hypothetical protein